MPACLLEKGGGGRRRGTRAAERFLGESAREYVLLLLVSPIKPRSEDCGQPSLDAH